MKDNKHSYEELEKEVNKLKALLSFLNISETSNHTSQDKKDYLSLLIDTTLDAIPDIIGVQDSNHNIIRYNKAGYNFLQKSHTEVAGKKCFEIIGKSEVCENCATQECYKTKKPAKKTSYFPELDIWFDMRSYPVLDNEGKVVLVIEHLRDISEQIKLQKELKSARDDWRGIFKAIGHPTVILDTNHKIIEANDKVINLSGITKEKIIGKHCWEVFHNNTDNMHVLNCPMHQLLSSGNTNAIEMEMEAFNGTYLVSCTPILDCKGEIKKIIHIATDVSERVKSRDLLKENNRFLETLINNLPGIVYRCKNDKQWTMEYLGGKCKEITGYESSNFINNKMLSFNDLIDKTDRDRIWNKWQQVLANKDVFIDEYKIIDIKGNYKWVWEQGLGIYDKNNNVIALEGFIADITEQKNAEIILKQKNAEIDAQNEEYKQINEEYKQINFELSKAKQKAEESDRLKMAFLANMSHEIRTPMNGILGFAGLLAQSNISHEKRSYYSQIIKNSGNQLLSIINDIIDISKIETNQISINYDLVDLNKVFYNIQSFFSPIFINNKITFKVIKPKDTNITIYTDEVRLNQILTNLLSNAIKFTRKGSVELACEEKEECWMFYVKDTGIGIQAEHHGIIFERFRQVETDYSKMVGGTGLGLPISKAFVELLGGKMWMESEYNKGSCFYFIIPKHKHCQKTDKKPYKSIKVSDIQETLILVAEDDEINSIHLRELFENTKVKLLFAKNGLDAVNFIKTNPNIELIIMDVKMPDMNGIEATQKIKTMRPDIPIIAFTAYALSGDKERMLSSGFDSFLAKPFKEEDLFEKISSLLKKRI